MQQFSDNRILYIPDRTFSIGVTNHSGSAFVGSFHQLSSKKLITSQFQLTLEQRLQPIYQI